MIILIIKFVMALTIFLCCFALNRVSASNYVLFPTAVGVFTMLGYMSYITFSLS